MFRKFARRADILLQSEACLVQPLVVEEPAANPGAGVYSSVDWSQIRRVRTEPFRPELDRYGSDDNYRQYLASVAAAKIAPVEALFGSFDFERYRRIIELGCGDMPQAYAVGLRYPGVRYTATDFDATVIEKCSRIQLLAGIRKMVIDVTRDDLDELRNHDLVVSWSFEYSLSDAQLSNLFAACKRNSVPYLLCTHTAIGPLEYLVGAFSSAYLKNRLGENRLRLLGWLRSVGEIARLAKRAGMRLEWKSRYLNYVMLLLVP